MSSSVSIPADMTQPSDPQPGEPAADPPAAAAWQAQRAPAARSLSPTGPLIAVIVLLAGGIGGLMLRDLNGLDADIARLDTDIARLDADIAQFRTDVDTRFDSLEAGVAEIARTLAVLIAELNARAAVDAALAGRILDPDAAEPGSAQP